MLSPEKMSLIMLLSGRSAQRNNLKLNRTKSVEIIFEDRRRKSPAQHPPTLPDIQRATQIKILGITVTNHLSISEHVRDV